MPQDYIRALVDGRDLTADEACDAVGLLMDGTATPAQIAGLLVALRLKGETVEEVAGFARGMRARATPVRPRRSPLLDTCGTGGSQVRVFNVSTAVALAAAAGGANVAKHGNRAMTGTCGSADVLEALGVRLDLTPEQVAQCVDEVGIGFCFAQRHHPAVKAVAPVRRELGVRTVFNLLGPLSNPAGATRQSVGVYEPRLCALAAGALKELGCEHAIVFHGEIGLDEISTVGQTLVYELIDGDLRSYTLTREALGLSGPEPDLSDLAPAPTPEQNADYVREAIGGPARGPAAQARQELVAVNAAAALRVYGLAHTWPEAVCLAYDLLHSGAAAKVVDRLVAFTNA